MDKKIIAAVLAATALGTTSMTVAHAAPNTTVVTGVSAAAILHEYKSTVNQPIETINVNKVPDQIEKDFPPGVTWDVSTKTIKGTPTQTGEWSVNFWYNTPGGIVERNLETYRFIISDPSTSSSTPTSGQTTPSSPTVTPTTITVGDDISGITVVQGEPIQPIVLLPFVSDATIDVKGLPEGITYDTATHTISGAPTTPGTYTVSLESIGPNGSGARQKSFTITVTTAGTVSPVDSSTQESVTTTMDMSSLPTQSDITTQNSQVPISDDNVDNQSQSTLSPVNNAPVNSVPVRNAPSHTRIASGADTVTGDTDEGAEVQTGGQVEHSVLSHIANLFA